MSETARIVFTPSGKRGRFPLGTPLLQAARRLGVDLDSICGGRGLCGRCQVIPAEGEFAKHGISAKAGHVSLASPVEARYAARKGLAGGRRLGCQACLMGDLVVDVPADSQVHRQVVRKAADLRPIALDPVVRLHYVQVAEPDLHQPASDLRRLEQALAEQWQLADLVIDLRVLRQLQKALRAGEWAVTVAVHAGRQIIAIWPGLKERVCGIAFDVGSTTIAGHLCDLGTGELLASAGQMNPQIRFGEDLMSRVSYIMLNPGGDAELTGAVRQALGALSRELAEAAAVPADEILALTVVGNPVMHHLLFGIDPTELGGAPFALATDGAMHCTAAELALAGVSPSARIYALPCIAGHVGADCAAVVLAEAPQTAEPLTLIVDVGTNAELVLGNRDRLLAASSPTGPAFEGAQISCGQRAAPGAIERVRIDPSTLEPRFKVIGAELWSDDPGFAAATAGLGVTGICGSGIIEILAELFLAGVIRADGTIDGSLAGRSPRIQPDGRTFSYLLQASEPELRITQADVRAIQLAKAALWAGARLLMDHAGAARVERVVLAGAFGSHIDGKYAMVLGLIPDCALDQVSSAGNAAGTGARIALLNHAARAEIEQLVRRIEKIETAVEPRFQEHFVGAMGVPHSTEAYPELAKAVALPTPSDLAAGAEAAGQRPRRRRRG